jgi:hypothetical protein
MVPDFYFIAIAIVGSLSLFVLLFFAFRRAFTVWAQYRGPQVVICPETRKPAGVSVDMQRAEKAAFLDLKPEIRLASCSRWPEREGCGQECLAQIESAPGECGVRFQLEQWYRGKPCVFCRKTFGPIQWHDHKPSLVNAEGKFVEWSDIAAEKLPEVLDTHFPVCWSCEAIERFRREHPELVTEISAREGASRSIR